jgi:hypothetical protein
MQLEFQSPLSIYVDLFDNDLDKNIFVVEKINENFDPKPQRNKRNVKSK